MTREEALEQQPCEDCISRQAAIDACLSGWNKDYKEIVEEIRTLPPVTPKPKMGRWIDDGQYAEGHSEHACRCSKCGYTYIGYTDEYKECQNCGAKMVESQERED